MSVTLKIKTPPDVTKLGPTHSAYKSTTIYITPPSIDMSTPKVLPNAALQPAAVGLSFVRNNRVIGYFSDVTQARLAIDYLIQRENEFGADI
jgi:hypothetical protein